MSEQGVGAGAVGVCPHSSQSGIAERYALRLLATLRCARRASWGFTKDRMGRAELLALVNKSTQAHRPDRALAARGDRTGRVRARARPLIVINLL